MMEVAQFDGLSCVPSPHPTTVDLIFRSLVFVHAVCHICAVDELLESAADNLLIAGAIHRTRRGNNNTAVETGAALFKPNG
jgi:hypothetical protein